jgi:ubiquinone/menaquinone biosynthesis C-methylase UbiE
MEREEYERLYELENDLWWFRGMRAISMGLLERHLPKHTGLRILDAGCGTGGMLTPLATLGAVIGLDASEDAMRWARLRAGTSLVRATVTALPFRSECFDLVTSFDVLYHMNVYDDGVALAEIARVLRPGGSFLVRVPAYDKLRSRHDEAVHTRQRYEKGELVEKLRAAGLEPVAVTFANSFLFPVALARRLAERIFPPRRQSSEVERVPRSLDKLLGAPLLLESKLVRHVSLPFGLSLVSLARKAAA